MTSTNNPNALDKNGKTPFQLATANGHSEILELLTSMIKTRGEEEPNKKMRFE